MVGSTGAELVVVVVVVVAVVVVAVVVVVVGVVVVAVVVDAVVVVAVVVVGTVGLVVVVGKVGWLVAVGFVPVFAPVEVRLLPVPPVEPLDPWGSVLDDPTSAPDCGATLLKGPVGAGASHVGRVTVLVSRFTSPFRARTRPFTVAPDCTVTELEARMLPLNSVLSPRFADPPTCQNTLHARAPLISSTEAVVAVLSEAPAWKMNTEPSSSRPSRIRMPVRPRSVAWL